MKKKIKNLLVVCILFVTHTFNSFCSQEEFLSQTDVFLITSQLITYHVDATEINEDILTKSIHNYINSFDPHKIYLLEEELSAFVSPSQNYKKQLLEAYKNQDLSEYYKLHNVIKNSIVRARKIRNKIIKNNLELFHKAEDISQNKIINRTNNYPNNISEIQEKQKDFLAILLSSYLSNNSKEKYLGKEDLLINLVEKQLVNLENEYLGNNEEGESLSYEKQQHLFLTKIIKSIASGLDAHTAYFSTEEANNIKIQLEKGMCGLGIVLGEDINGIVIKEVLENGPAFKSGKVKEGDVIKKINGKEISHFSFKKVLELLRGKENSLVILELESQEQMIKEVPLVRSKIALNDKRVDVSYETFQEGIIGKITLHSFYEGNDNISSELDIKEAINNLKEKNLLGLVLDLRENSGGFLSQAVKVSGLFMSNGVVVIAKYFDDNLKYYRTFNGSKFYDGPLIVLVSKCSASAAEIVAQALQDYGVAIIVGDEHTYGKGTIQHQTITGRETGKESLFKVTVGRYYTVSGKSTQISGVKADILVPSQYHESNIGERYLPSPLPEDKVLSAYNDSLEDLEPFAKKWFQKYYLPKLQKKESLLTQLLPQLRKNSGQRILSNPQYQQFLDSLKNPTTLAQEDVDLQMEESINIMKDLLSNNVHVSLQKL